MENKYNYTKKQLIKMLLPSINTIINDKYKVIYQNHGNLRFTAVYKDNSDDIGLNTKIIIGKSEFIVTFVDEKRKRFTATLSGIISDEKDVEELSKENNVEKLI